MERKHRIFGKNEFKKIYDNPGKVLKTSNFTILVSQPNNSECGKLGVVVAKKRFRSAVTRNLIKRRIREQFRKSTFAEYQRTVIIIVKRNKVKYGLEKIAKKIF